MSDTIPQVFNKHGSSFYLGDAANVQHKFLPAGNYIVKKDGPMSPLSLLAVEQFEMPPKLYGKTNDFSARVLGTFDSRPNTTGILLSGEKGSGKTLQAKAISNLAAKSGYPTLIINTPWVGDEFNTLIQRIKQPCIVFFDEFEKVYNREEQQEVLTLFDGVFPSKKLFMLTCNDKYSLDSHLRNRPGRLFYAIDYEGLEEQFIREYCMDVLDNKSHIDKICEVSKMFGAFNFDILKAMVEEMNRYKESPAEVLQVLNASLSGESNGEFEPQIFHVDSSKLSKVEMSTSIIEVHPLHARLTRIYFEDHTNYDPKDPNSEYPDTDHVDFTPKDFKCMGPKGSLVFESGNGISCTFTRKEERFSRTWSSILG